MAHNDKFVLFPLGRKRFALPAGNVTELARPDHLHVFPHTTPWLTGVLLRRGKLIPVLDVAQVVLGPEGPSRKFYLIANRRFAEKSEWTAVPVTGECELVTAAAVPSTEALPPHVSGLLSLDDEIVEVLDLDKVASAGGAV
jgi:chemotaxis signal transduction protein